MTKRKFNQLLKQTKEHWENDILNAPASVFAEDSPIHVWFCPTCLYFGECSKCFLHEQSGELFACLNEVIEANKIIEAYQSDKENGLTYSIRPVRQVCKKAYRAILKRFGEYRQEHFEGV